MKKPLVIGVDVRDLKKAKTGIKTYLEEICREFRNMDAADVRFHFLDTAVPIYTGNVTFLKWTEHFRYHLWKQLILPIKAYLKRCDIVFCADDYVPYVHLGYVTIPVIHDAFPFESPQNYGKAWLWLFKRTVIPGAKRSPLIITTTKYSQKQISYHMNIPHERLVPVYEGAKRAHLGGHDGDPCTYVIQKFDLTPGKYILHVGSLFKRKNLPALVNAYAKIRQQHDNSIRLVLAGSISTSRSDNDHQLIVDTIAEHRLQNEVILTDHLNDMEVEQLYQHALMYVFPSVNEGFGIPVLEAFKHHLPTLVANNTCLPEVGADAVLTFDPYNIDDMAEKISKVLTEPGLRQSMIVKGQQRLKSFSWQATAQRIVEVFKTVKA